MYSSRSAPLGPEVPVHPRQVVVLAVAVVVAPLGAPQLVARHQHGHPLGQEQGGQEVALLAAAEGEHVGIVGVALDAAVPRPVVVGAVAVVLAVGLVVLAVVGDQVAQGEPVVGGDEVDRRRRLAGAALVEVARPGEPVAHLGQARPLPPPEVPHRVPVLPVPFRPQDREVAHLVAALPQVPRLGDELDRGHDRVLVDEVEERAQPVGRVHPPGQGGGQVEAEAVDVHVGDPVAEAVEDEVEDLGVAGVEGVAAAGEVDVAALVARGQPVVGRVVDPPQAEGGAELVALGGVVVDDVEDHLDAGRVEGQHHRLELPHLLAPGARRRVLGVGGEVAERVVAPVVGQAPPQQVGLRHEVVDGHELHRGHAEPDQVVDHRGAGQAGVGAPQAGGHVGVEGGEALDVQLVDHGVVPRGAGVGVVAPREEGVGHHRPGDVGGRVAPVALVVGAARAVAEDGLVPVEAAVDGQGVGVDEQLGRVEAQAPVGFPGAVDPVAVALPGHDPGEVAVPHVAVDLGQRQAGLDARRKPADGSAQALVVEQAQLNRGGALAEQGEVGTLAIPGGARW